MQIVNHAQPYYAQSRLAQLIIWDLSRVTPLQPLLRCFGRAREHGTKFHMFCKETIAELVELLHREAKIQIDG